MKKSEKRESLLLQLLKEIAQGETLDSVVQRLRQEMGKDAPIADAVWRYLLQPNDTASLDVCQRALGVSPSSGYELMHEPRFPVLKIGSRMVVPKEKFQK